MTETISELGLPAIAGAVVGGLIAHFSARARGREEHVRTLDLFVTQDERRTAQAMLDATRSLRNSITMKSAGQLHNEWSDLVLGPARVIRDDEIHKRVRAGAYVIFLATLLPDEHTSYAVLRGALDVEEWLEAWLRREPPPGAHLPSMEDIGRLVRSGGTLSIQPLNDLLAKRAQGDFADE